MKLRLLFGTLMLTAMTANAQVATINENFDGFVSGSVTFPQNGWSIKLATNPLPFPPAPLMIVTTDANKAVQAYSGNNTNQPSYLITPQIVTPAGDKALSFTATAAEPYTSSGTIQIGVASNPTDMSTFVAVGSPVTIVGPGTIQNINVPIPASTGTTYLVFKFTPTVAHTALQIDNVVYNTSSTLAVSDAAKSKEEIKFAVNAENTELQFVAKKDPKNIQVYATGGQKVAEGKLKGQIFDISALQTGVYYIIIETAEESVVKSKFIKK
ncbi:T9SS-dependent choice-of-anchor J family protein [Chryseobacterium polytrichastri]|uniref:Por secretion system C-terminal sorting domain-containing protein n=1 Tax=Chryseobacterium polytrichastri TaxID=1302687 RepID=A0A1M7FUU6_9FLAO|nr:choice-of-anchor J domain-containing protein [Chryseobacterium polytrichastri]SHM07776.1 Por secretion system C-terminal sorting domain-containing protein [Chryseobacterium polytrichastri]